jgi:hypothetical protein
MELFAALGGVVVLDNFHSDNHPNNHQDNDDNDKADPSFLSSGACRRNCLVCVF